MKQDLLKRLRDGESLSLRQQLLLILQLSVPAIMAQISTIIMQYIDASMVGRLGSDGAAAIGLVASTTWLVGGICMCINTGNTVIVAQKIGAGDEKGARETVLQGLLCSLLMASFVMLIGNLIAGHLPIWLGGDEILAKQASVYFRIFALALPFNQLNNAAAGMLQGSGNMKAPGLMHVVMCFLDMIFNAILIFESGTICIPGTGVVLPGLGMGVAGAALGTALAQLVSMLVLMYLLLIRSDALHLRGDEQFHFCTDELHKMARIAIPVGVEQVIMGSAYVCCTTIVAPLGQAAIAANSFSVTAESLCYMPGYGIGAAATTLIGQSIGAGQKDLTKRLAWLSIAAGVGIMTFSGICMYLAAPVMIGLLSTDSAVRELGTMILRIEAFAEPLYGASIVATAVFRGAGDTLGPSILNFVSMWLVRIPMSALLASRMGLKGVWTAMCLELCFRGTVFLIRMLRSDLTKRIQTGESVK